MTVDLLPLESETGFDYILTTSSVLRSRYHKLSFQHKKEMLEHLKALFPEVEAIEEIPGKQTLLIIENNRKLEILEYGTAFQKILFSFALLFTLIAQSEQSKIFLMEEPETGVNPSLFETFFEDLYKIGMEHGIHFIWTSNSPFCYERFRTNCLFLSRNREPAYLSENPELDEVVKAKLFPRIQF